jgi:hypothetical protein
MLKYHIQTIELSAASKAITFSSIPQNFDDLLLVYSTRSDRAGNVDDPVNIAFSGSSSGYSSRGIVGTGSTTYSEGYGSSVVFAGYMPAASTTENTFGNGSLLIGNYRSSSAKTISVDFVSENNATTAYQNVVASIWANSAAVTSLTVSAQIANLVQFSSASLYGIRRGSDGRTEVASGGTITTSGGFTIHTFNTSGTFVANRNLDAEVLVVAGGGGGGSSNTVGLGAGGGGGYLASSGVALSAGSSFAVTVGGGGAIDANGSNSTFLSLSAIGGGRGGDNDAAGIGGSGGGAGLGVATGAAGTAGQGNAGGNMFTRSGYVAAGGGGGASGVGGNGNTNNQPGNGGPGIVSSITGTAVGRAGGGGGGLYNEGNQGTGGTASDGGGAGGRIYGNGQQSINGTAGTANTGGGGGGGGGAAAGQNSAGAAGGSGVVIIRYLTPA